MLKVCNETDIGLVRKSNQDACNGGVLGEQLAWAVVCDGMGGANGGNIASQLAVEQISKQILSFPPEHMQGDAVKKLISAAVFNANAAVYDRSRQDETLRGMGTTVVVAIFAEGVVHIAHAGDSRAYLIAQGGMKQLTTDHSMVQEMLDNGDLTEQEARRHPHKNIITRALGVLPTVELDYCEYEFGSGSRLLICTDGLTNYVENEQISQLSKGLEAQDFCKTLVEAAKEGGGGDNVTVAVIEY